MDEADCAPRVRELSTRVRELEMRQAELQDEDDVPPAQIDADTLKRVHERLEQLLLEGDAAPVKALMHDLVAEVLVEDPSTIRPVFRLPAGPVRNVGKMVGGEGLEPSTSALSALRSAC